MIRTYLYKNITQFIFHNLVGFFIMVMAFLLFMLVNQNNEIRNLIKFICFIFFLILLVFQTTKSYLIYIPSTYIHIIDTGLQIKKVNKNVRFYEWNSIEKIELFLENNWFLNINIIFKDSQKQRFILTDLWLLSFSKKACVKHNFLIVMYYLKNNDEFKNKFDMNQINDFKEYLNLK